MPRLTITLRNVERGGERVRVLTPDGHEVWLSYRGMNNENPHTAVVTFEADREVEIMRECRLVSEPKEPKEEAKDGPDDA